MSFIVLSVKKSNLDANDDADSFKSTQSTLDGKTPINLAISSAKGDENDSVFTDTPPVPPPRTRRGLTSKAAKAKLKDLHLAAESLEIVANELLNIGDAEYSSPALPGDKHVIRDRENELKGNLHMLVVSAKGLRQAMKTRWFVYDKKSGKLKYFRNEQEEKSSELPLGQLDLSTATFCYDLETDVNGEFVIV